MEAWHFLKKGGYTGEGNLLVVEGQTMRVPPPVELCHHGFHFSILALDALLYAPGPVVQRVWVPDDSILGDDKGVAPERKCLWMYDATEVLHEFACMCAESALMIAGVEDERSWNAIHVKREWLAGRASDGDLAAAEFAAMDETRVAAEFAAMAEARAKARDAAETRVAAVAAAKAAAIDKSWEAVEFASWNMARAAAWAEKRVAARAKARDTTEDTAEEPAWDETRSAAMDEAWAEINAELERMLFERMLL